ncbi:shikimate dehydrogenase [Corynebacterium zhongnanshanii]|uniref:Shikimate dehydrogenase n=1 Tax=Corynebacterium zhongnanshanii TaxID=2768834 RepID=A0ABQ6VG96_9CORY|nr:shikimate dehydrogenase [Corynebacterium zhongnanshanii]KAB3523439.1 shikimate dehydrogenase [Corynebacterium zhongnanshanii]
MSAADGVRGAEPGTFLSIEEFLTLAETFPDRLCALLGRPIEHSKSPVLHNTAAAAAGIEDFLYVRVEAGERDEVSRLLTGSGASVAGFSVTMPGKSAALELADKVTERATRIGSANTLVPQPDGTWLADNTDVVGVQRCLEHCAAEGIDYAGTHAVVVGNGGTARPAIAALGELGVSRVTVLARSERALQVRDLVTSYGMEFEWLTFDADQVAERCAEASVVINTIPSAAVEPYTDLLVRARSVVDVIYDPFPPALIAAAQRTGIPHADGLRMLAGQAEEQFRYFTGQYPPQGLMLRTVAP